MPHVRLERRLNPPLPSEVDRRLREIDFSFQGEIRDDLLVFYHPSTLRQIAALRNYFLNRKLDAIDEWIRMVAINRLTGHSPGFFSVYTLPPNQAAVSLPGSCSTTVDAWHDGKGAFSKMNIRLPLTRGEKETGYTTSR